MAKPDPPEPGEDPLRKYREKRDPGRTNEPFASVPAAGGTRVGSFVVHLHDASREHYDLRIQAGNTLLSFAVPKGPSLNPVDKRLAVQTENHPLEYREFEDVIPDGNYGAGPMIVWDTGTVRYLEDTVEDGLAKGKVDFWLDGYKLKGRFALVETGSRQKPKPKQPQWLLLKKTDVYSNERDIVQEEPYSVISGLRVEQLESKQELVEDLVKLARAGGAKKQKLDVSNLSPMLCATDGATLHDTSRIYELKLDGVRIVADKQGEEVNLRYRKQRAATLTYPEVVRSVRALAPKRIVLDGEIVAFDDQGKPSFERLATRIHATRPLDVARARRDVPVVYMVFDVLAVEDWDLTSMPLLKRKEILMRLLPGRGRLRALDHLNDDGRPLFELCKHEGLEGVVAKRKDAVYRPGPKRFEEWVKIKTERDDEFVIVGWERKRRSRTLGSLILAAYEGDELKLRGKVGSGLDDATQDLLIERLGPIEIDSCPASGELERAPMERHFVEPRYVVSVRYLGWSDSGSLRFPVFRGLRIDKDPRDCTAMPGESRLEIAPPADSEDDAPLSMPAPFSSARPQTAGRRGERLITRAHLTNQAKVFWPDEGYTKGELCEYYAAIADTLLPFLKGRPIMLVRYPDGITGKNFYQWNAPKGTPDWLRTLQIRHEERDGKTVSTFLIDDADGLIHIANLGCIPIHVLACREGSLDTCDFLTIDFDMADNPFRHAVTLALSLRDLLGELGLVGFPKTSGQTGMHVMIPMGDAARGGGVPFETAKILVELIGRLLWLRHQDITTMERRVTERGGKILIDVGQTGRSRTIVGPYSVRAYPGARVSTPLEWDEVHLALDPAAYTMFTVPARMAEREDPLRGLMDVEVDVVSAVAKLERLLAPHQ
ncbi:MAG: DNA ligase D [Polyangiaceae bacterium]